MKERYEDAYARAELQHPWFVARRRLFLELVGDAKQARILDVGCGTGLFLSHLKQRGFTDLAGVEPSDRLRQQARDASIPVYETVPQDRTFDVVFMLDVLEHIADDVATLGTIRRALVPGGRFLLSVPAHPFLWGPHDELNLHQRRYRKGELREKLLAEGFEVGRMSYWNAFAFPLVGAVRWLKVGRGRDSGDFGVGPPLALRAYGLVLRVEHALIRRFDLPAGTSLVAVARTPAT